MKPFSAFGQKFTQASGIIALMQDLGEAVNSNDPETCMLGGGNPALIPTAVETFRQEMQAIIDNGQFDKALGFYSSPQGENQFIDALVNFINEQYDWGITRNNIALTNGSQNSFFYLFNLLAGDMEDGSKKKILFPLSPEYIGYRELGLSDDMITSQQPTIEYLDCKQFKYHIDFDALTVTEDIAAICISRPTNPTGNVITNDELAKLDTLAKENGIPLIIDNAYGAPFPGTIYTDAELYWHDNIILGMSLSKLGLPGLRTGIVIAKDEIINVMSAMNGTLCLSPSNMGASLMTRLIESKDIIHLRDNVIRPYYEKRMQDALALAQDVFSDMPIYIHKPEGAFFLWLWFKDLPISSKVLYQRLKARKVFIIPGEDFFIGMDEDWSHQRECIRINYASPEDQLKRGLIIIREELLLAYNI
ncbi:MAG: valine--pyruvate aminotransferase [Candidatus Endobugula sp.]|jgi:valine--pyruvate aminotransferase